MVERKIILLITLSIFVLLSAGCIENSTVTAKTKTNADSVEDYEVEYSVKNENIDTPEIEQIIYPSEAPEDLCIDSRGRVHPATGEGYANWFNYGGNGCGGWKIYDVTPGDKLKLRAHGDECPTCPACILGDINFYIYDYFDGQWNEMKFIDGPDNHCGEYIEYYTPIGNRIKIVAESGFYLDIYHVLSVDLDQPEPKETLEDVSLAGRYDTAGLATSVAIAGNYAYVADFENGLVIVDVSDPTSPTLASRYDTAGLAVGVAVAGNYAYVADSENGLVIVDVSTFR